MKKAKEKRSNTQHRRRHKEPPTLDLSVRETEGKWKGRAQTPYKEAAAALED